MLEEQIGLGLIVAADPGEEGGGLAAAFGQWRQIMDSVFPGMGSNPFDTAPLAKALNAGRKADAAKAPRPAGGYPSQVEKSNISQNSVAHPGRGARIDYQA